MMKPNPIYTTSEVEQVNYPVVNPVSHHQQNIDDDVEKGADYLFRQTTDLTHKRCRELVKGIFYAIHNG